MAKCSVARLLVVPALLGAMSLAPAFARAQDATPVGGEVAAPPLPANAALVASGLHNPRGLAFGPDGLLYVAEAGGQGEGECFDGPEGPVCVGSTGAVARIVAPDDVERVVEGIANTGAEGTGDNATGPHDLTFLGDTLYVVTGLGADPADRAGMEANGGAEFGRVFSVDVTAGSLTEVADIAAFEASDNPDGGLKDTNPYAIAVLPDGMLGVVDAGANDLLRVDPASGAVSTIAVFPDRMVPGPDGAEMPMNAVPDAITIGPDGAVYVGELTGFPFPVDGAEIYRVNPETGDTVLHADNFTNIIDIAAAPDGSFYVLEHFGGGMLNADPADPGSLTGALTRINVDGSRDVISNTLMFPGGLAIDENGAVYVSNFGTSATGGQILRFPAEGGAPEAIPAGTPVATPVS